MIHVTASIEIQPEKEAEFLAAMTSVAGPTRQEAGCLEYHLHRSVDQPGKFLMIESWKSPEDLESHLASPHVRELFAAAEGILAAPVEIRSWTRVEI